MRYEALHSALIGAGPTVAIALMVESQWRFNKTKSRSLGARFIFALAITLAFFSAGWSIMALLNHSDSKTDAAIAAGMLAFSFGILWARALADFFRALDEGKNKMNSRDQETEQ